MSEAIGSSSLLLDYTDESSESEGLLLLRESSDRILYHVTNKHQSFSKKRRIFRYLKLARVIELRRREFSLGARSTL
jgi:hypothetical protein